MPTHLGDRPVYADGRVDSSNIRLIKAVATLPSPSGCHGHHFTPVILFLGPLLQIGPLKVAFFVHYLQNGTIFLVDAPAGHTFGDAAEILEDVPHNPSFRPPYTPRPGLR